MNSLSFSRQHFLESSQHIQQIEQNPRKVNETEDTSAALCQIGIANTGWRNDQLYSFIYLNDIIDCRIKYYFDFERNAHDSIQCQKVILGTHVNGVFP